MMKNCNNRENKETKNEKKKKTEVATKVKEKNL